jgi:hypothetical protein
MDFDNYYSALDSFADEIDENELLDDPLLYLHRLKGSGGLADACAEFRAQMLTDSEIENVSPWFQIGYFPDRDERLRAAWWVLYQEVIYTFERRSLRRECARYQSDQPLFKGAPKLFSAIRRRAENDSPDYELIDDGAVESINESEVYQVEDGFAKLTTYLPASIPAWAREAFARAPRYLRLNPYRYYDTKPLQKLEEVAIVPANPHWMATVALFPNHKQFACYQLENCDPKDDMAQARDYQLRHVRRLEISAQRRQGGHLSMMIEELCRDDDPNGVMVGRCIHLDTHAVVGTPMRDVQLDHLDLAINAYENADRDRRMKDSLQNGKVVDATFRTHLYRIEKIPFTELFGFAERFLRSRVLLREWATEVIGPNFAKQIAVPGG